MNRIIQDPDASIQVLTGDDWGTAITSALEGASRSILISMFLLSHHWRPSYASSLNLIDSLQKATLRGIQGRCLLAAVAQRLTHEYPNLKASQRLVEAGWHVRFMPANHTLHEKILVIDNETVLLGSHNLAKSNATANFDTSLMIHSKPLADQLTRQFWTRWRLGRGISYAVTQQDNAR